MKKLKAIIIFCVTLFAATAQTDSAKYVKEVPGRWSAEKANAWYAKQPWLVGANYLPATAINQIDMWQASTWDAATIDKEMGWAESIGMNTMRVFLHDMVWASDKKGLYKRMDEFLNICKKHGIRPWFVFFDDCHYPNPTLGKQPLPVRNFHNSGWLNSPARDLAIRFANDSAAKQEVKNLKGYVQETMKRFKNDDRVLMWELYNEPGRGNNFDGRAGGSAMNDKSNKLVYTSWVWAREVNPSQPVTSCSEGSLGKNNIIINRMNADVHSIHNYSGPKRIKELIVEYKKDGRPVLMTEWLARTQNSTVQDILPILKEEKVAAVNWGFVSGESGTVWPWRSRRDENDKPISVNEQRAKGKVVKPGEPFPEPELWFHDLFRTNGTPFSKEEIKIFKQLTGKN
ncbi:cellulase family glycosylhydrolase [Lacibacter sp.]|uniref:cellulase family glycosylhydrolase n=1 Tax=Lacibacter sp. TaxID=1915409 RepID=UPI002B4B23F7|nr:cellulase family glycosylhydrolase [Lacibacter sp.]HLP37699.1 cellulase family glycosylhydrolase [Lacibacter sp.]